MLSTLDEVVLVLSTLDEVVLVLSALDEVILCYIYFGRGCVSVTSFG